LGSALNTLQTMPLPDATRAVLTAHAPLADAICYVFGEVGLILFLTVVAPRLMKIDLAAVAREAEAKLRSSGVPDADTFLAYTPLTYRAYRIDNPRFAGLSVEAFEHEFANGRLIVESFRRAGRIHRKPALEEKLEQGDVVALISRRPGIVAAAAVVGAEVDDAELLSVPLQEVSIILTRGEMAGLTLGELSNREARGIYLLAITRGQQALPREPGTRVQRGDVFRLTGSPEAIARAAERLGYIEPDPARTDLVYLAGGIVVGTLVGLLQLHVAGVPLGLGGSGGVLVVGLVAGWIHSRYPVFGRIPESAQRLLSDVGLIVFISAIGLAAGPHALEAIDQGGIELFAKLIGAGVVVTMTGPILGLLFGRWVLKMPPVSLLPGIAGSQTTVATLNALKERSGSDVYSLGFTVPFAVSNVLLTMWGPVIVAFAFSLQR